MGDDPRRAFAGLKEELLALIGRGMAPLAAEGFDSLALRVFAFQYDANPAYRAYCDALGAARPSGWRDVPGLPTTAFKRMVVTCLDPSVAGRWFQTSGTTEGESGRHYFDDHALYEAALLPPFARFLGLGAERMRMLILTPAAAEAPNSSLSHMMGVVARAHGAEGSRHFVSDGQLDTGALFAALRDAERGARPVILLGTGFAFVHALDAMRGEGTTFPLPPGSRIMETGGFKGRSREIPRETFYPELAAAFGVPLTHIINEYGMTELSSQFYDRSMVDAAPTDWKSGPPWVRVTAVDPLTGTEVPDGKPGLLRIVDLANLASVAFLQTEDVGVVGRGRFRVLGRVGGASVRGCSVGAEDLLRGGPAR